MKQVFLIHAHKDLDQLNALVEQLLDQDFLVYVNVDLKSALDVARVHPAARLVQNRIAIHWGDFSQVQATLNSLAEIVATVPEFDKVLFLSAQDAPLLSNARLKRELAQLAGHELLDSVAIGEHGWSCAYRYQYFHRASDGALAGLACGVANRALRMLGLQRRMVNRYQPWGGSSWWALSRACVQSILETVERDRAIVRFFASVACPDELFFQTLVMNSPFRERVLANNFRYIQWPATGARNPEVLQAGDFEKIRSSGAHFCRKIEPVASAGLLPLLLRLKEDL